MKMCCVYGYPVFVIGITEMRFRTLTYFLPFENELVIARNSHAYIHFGGCIFDVSNRFLVF